MLIWSVPYPVCLPRRWKWDEINIGLSHHLVAHRIEVQRLAEDFDYSPALCQARFKLFITAFSTFIVFSFLFLSSSPCCLCCCRSVWRFVTHQVWPVCDLFPSILPPHPCMAESITIQIITHIWIDSFYFFFSTIVKFSLLQVKGTHPDRLLGSPSDIKGIVWKIQPNLFLKKRKTT